MLFEKSLIKNFMQQNLQINLKSVAVESFTFLKTEGFVYTCSLALAPEGILDSRIILTGNSNLGK